MMQDAFEEEAFEGLSTLKEGELELDISQLRKTISHRSKKQKRIIPVWFRLAASIIIILSIGYATFSLLDNRISKENISKEQFAYEEDLFEEKTKKPIAIAENTKKESIKEEVPQIAQKEFITQKEVKEEKKRAKREIAKKAAPEKQITEIKKEEIIVAEKEVIIQDENLELEETKLIADLADEEVLDADTTIKSEQPEEKPYTVTMAKRKAAQPAVSKAAMQIAEMRTIKGKILSSEDGMPLPGVQIALKETTQGTVTNTNGEFEISLPETKNQDEALVARYVGFEEQEIQIVEDSDLMVYMEPSNIGLEEVVVVGYGVERKPTGAVADINEEHSTSTKPPGSISIKEFKKEILNKIDYAKLYEFPGKHKIKFKFTISEKGVPGNFEFTRFPNQVFADEIERVITDYGKWIPATSNDKNIEEIKKMSLKIVVE